MRPVYAEPAHTAMHGGAINAEAARRLGNIAMASGEHRAKFGFRAVVARQLHVASQLFWKVLYLNQPIVAQGCGEGDRIVQLANIAWPAMIEDQKAGSV